MQDQKVYCPPPTTLYRAKTGNCIRPSAGNIAAVAEDLGVTEEQLRARLLARSNENKGYGLTAEEGFRVRKPRKAKGAAGPKAPKQPWVPLGPLPAGQFPAHLAQLRDNGAIAPEEYQFAMNLVGGRAGMAQPPMPVPIPQSEYKSRPMGVARAPADLVNVFQQQQQMSPSLAQSYADRPSPGFPAKQAPGQTVTGNDGTPWTSKQNVKGNFQWIRAQE